MKVLYHNDLDGKCAASLVFKYDDGESCGSYYPMDYGDPIPPIDPGAKVYILDYSIEPGEMLKLLELTDDVIWIDHHITAIDKYIGFSEDVKGIRSTKMSGCELTWRYLRGMEDPIPEYVRLIGDRDTWTWKYGDRTKFFNAGMLAEMTNPVGSTWFALGESVILERVIHDGEVVSRYRDIHDREYIARYGFWVNFEGHRCYAVNGLFSSEPFEAEVPNADIWLTFRYMPGDFWTVSLYSTKLDVSEVAKRYEYEGRSGGGHKGAAGFQCSYPPFIRKEA